MKNNAMKMLMPAFIVSIMLAAGFAAAVSGGDSEGTVSSEPTIHSVKWNLRHVTVEVEDMELLPLTIEHGKWLIFKPTCEPGYKDMTVKITVNGVTATLMSNAAKGIGSEYYYYCYGGIYSVSALGDVVVTANARSMTTVISPPATPVEKFYNVYTVSDPDYIKMVGIPADAKVRENAPLNVSISPASVPVKMNVTVTMGGKVMNDAFAYAAGSESSGTVLIGAVVGDVEISVAYEIVTSEGPTETADSNWWILVAVIIAGMALMLVYFRSRKSWQNA